MSDTRKLLTWGGIGCGVLLLFSCCFAGAFALYCGHAFTEPADHAHAFLEELREGELEAAYGRMSPGYRAANDRSRFREQVEAIPPLIRHVEATLPQRMIHPGRGAELGGSLSTPEGEIPIQMVLEQTAGQWVIVDVVVGNQRLGAPDPLPPPPVEGATTDLPFDPEEPREDRLAPNEAEPAE